MFDDLLEYQKAWINVWSDTKDTGYVPSKYLSTWNGRVEYVDWTDGKIEGMDKLEPIRKAMLAKCPVLSLPEHNAPVRVHWVDYGNEPRLGKYFGQDVTLGYGYDERIRDVGVIYWSGAFDWVSAAIWIGGRTSEWNYPNQTSVERGGFRENGIDMTFVHEWGHHLTDSIDINLGRTSHHSHMFSEFFARIVENLCSPSSRLDDKKLLTVISNAIDSNQKGIAAGLRRIRTLFGLEDRYLLRSMDYCMSNEALKTGFDHNAFLETVIDAYKNMNGILLSTDRYPVRNPDGDILTEALWIESKGYFSTRSKMPLMNTRIEFLSEFLKLYDCGPVNEIIEADIEGLKKFEW